MEWHWHSCDCAHCFSVYCYHDGRQRFPSEGAINRGIVTNELCRFVIRQEDIGIFIGSLKWLEL